MQGIRLLSAMAAFAVLAQQDVPTPAGGRSKTIAKAERKRRNRRKVIANASRKRNRKK